MPVASSEIEDTAASWVERMASGLTPKESEELSVWVNADPIHAAAVRKFEAVLKLASESRLYGGADALIREVETRARKRRNATYRSFALTSLGVAAAITLGVFLHSRQTPVFVEPLSTVTLHPDIRILEDGSRIELNAGAEVTIDFTAERRAVRLLRGEAMFEVARNPLRPFVVSVGEVNFRAVGTAFSVRLNPGMVKLLVSEGNVEVTLHSVPPAEGAEARKPIYVAAGSGATVDTASKRLPEVQSVTQDEMEKALGWRSRRVEFTLTPLGEAVKLFNRDNAIQIMITDPAIAEMKITGVFWTDDPAGFSRLLQDSLEISALNSDQTIVLQR